MEEALASPDKEKWLNAMETVHANDAWDWESVGSKWVFKLKVGVDGLIGATQGSTHGSGVLLEFGLDYGETFFPVVRFELF